MLNVIRTICSIIVVVLAAYSLSTKNYELMPYMLFFLGVSVLLSGIKQYQVKRMMLGHVSVGVSLFLFFTAIQNFLMQ